MICIPSVGEKVILKNDASLNLQFASKNNNFINKLKVINSNVKSINKDFYPLALKKGTILIIDRVYVRSGNSSAFNSITFKVNDSDYLPNGRFFVSLEVANSMGAEIYENDNESMPLMLEEYLSSKISKDNKNIGYFEALLESETKFLSRIEVKLNTKKTIKSLEKNIDRIFMEYFNINYKTAYESVLECVKADTNNINKQIANKAKESLKKITELNNIEGIQNLRSENGANSKPVTHSEVLLNKVVPCSEKTNIKNPFIFEYNYIDSSNTRRILNMFTNHLNLAKYIFLRYGNYSKLHSWNYAYGEFQFIGLTHLLSENPNLTNFMSEYGKSYNSSKKSYNSEIKEAKGRLFIPYENLRYFDVLSVNGHGTEESIVCFEYYDGDKKLTLKEARSRMINSKKRH